MAKYKTLPNYELIREGVYVAFNGDGIYETNDENIITVLDECKPFIQRLDEEKPKTKPATKKAEESTKPKAKSKPTVKPKATTSKAKK